MGGVSGVVREPAGQGTRDPAAESAHRSLEARAFSHDCRSSLTVIAAFAGLVREALDPESGADEIDMLAAVGKRVSEIEELIEEFRYLNVADPDARPEQLGPVSLADAFGAVASAIEKEALWQDMIVEFDDAGCAVIARRKGLLAALEGLLAHFRRVSNGSGTLYVTASHGPGGNEVSIAAELVDGPVAPYDDDAGPFRPADPDRFPYRLCFANRVAAECGGTLVVRDGNEACSASMVFPHGGISIR